MQGHNWNDLKFLLTLHRKGKLSEAGRVLGVSETTVARRIKALEQSLGTTLFLRSASGRYEPTDAGLQILNRAERVETENNAIRTISGDSAHHVAGFVRISSVPLIVNRFLIPRLNTFVGMYPDLTVELVPTSDNLDLSKREADLAVRFARPMGGGLRTKAQKLGEMRFGAYVSRAAPQDEGEGLRWITYDDATSDLPQARWLEAAAVTDGPANLKVADAETAMEAAAVGLGKTLLPRVVADADPRLQGCDVDRTAAFPTREVWLLSHIDQTSRLSVAATKTWLAGLTWT